MDPISKFLIELVKRFSAETPWFFKVIRNLSIATAIVAGLPEFLSFLTLVGVELPQIVFVFSNKVVAISSLVAAFVAQLTATTQEKEALNIPDNIR
jgi:hypothetical protein